MKLPYYLKVTDKVKYADSKMFRIRINPSYKDNVGLMAHEEQHVKQWYMFFVPLFLLAVCSWFLYREDVALGLAVLAFTLKGLLYTLLPRVRLAFEVDAYKAQMDALNDTSYSYYAELIVNGYDVDKTVEQVVAMLKS